MDTNTMVKPIPIQLDALSINAIRFLAGYAKQMAKRGHLGKSVEGAALAGHLKLGKWIYLRDDNHIQ